MKRSVARLLARAATAQEPAACSAAGARRGYAVGEVALTGVNAVRAGTGRRSSVSGVTATVFGGNGFVGRYVVNALAQVGSQVVCPYRCVEEKAMPLKQMGDLGQMVLLRDFHLRDDDAVRHAIRSSNVVVNLIGARRETRNFTFDEVHAEWPARLARIVAEAGPRVERFIHFSDIGAAADHPAARMRSKAAGDAAVRATLPGATILRPADVVGEEDDFYNNLIGQCKWRAAVPLVDGGAARLQPTYVPDVAAAVMAALGSAASIGQTYTLAGPEVLSLRQVVDLVYKMLLVDEDETVALPAALARLAFSPVDKLNRILPDLRLNYMNTAGYVDELSVDRVAPAGARGYAELGITPTSVTEGLAVEMIRFHRVGGYRHGDMKSVSKAVPDHIKKFFGLDTIASQR